MASSDPVHARHHPCETMHGAVIGVPLLLLGIVWLGSEASIDGAVFFGAGAVGITSTLVMARTPACEYAPATNTVTRRSPLRRRGPFTPGPGQRFAVHDNAIVLAPEGASHGPVIVRRNRVHPQDWGALTTAVAEANERARAGSTAFGDDAALKKYYRDERRL